ncbi:MAG: hypothetical protein IJ598_09570 [Ruminococcus sp.]|nr:hypothetical protein [Ruminococcus sp.]
MKKPIAVILSALLLSTALTGCLPLRSFLPDEGNAEEETETYPVEDVTEPPMITDVPTAAPTAAPAEITVRPAEWAAVQWQPYSSPNFTLNIPAGWEVQWQGDANQLRWMATSPDKTVGITNIDHCYAAKDASMQQALGFSMSMENGTVREFFEKNFADSTEYFTVQSSCVPKDKDLLQSVRPYTPIHDYQALYATFKDENVEGEGIYSAVVMDSKDVIFNGANYGAWEVNCVLTQWAPQGRFVDWAPVLANIMQSFRYTEAYLAQWRQIANDATATPTTINDTDPVMEAFEERSKSDTIIQEKRSDMLEEYERVYDNESGKIYRAYNGFLDDIGDQNRYTPITDSQYADGYDGWIDK